MGFEQLDIKAVPFKDFSGGWFPLLNRSEIPENGSPSCQHVIWRQASLQKFFGCSKVNVAQVGAGDNGNGIFHASFGATDCMIAIFGTSFYESTDGISWTDRTGGMTITDGYPWLFRVFEEGTNKYVVMCNGKDAPLKWTGAGANAELLGGAPSSAALAHDYWHSYYWMSDTTNDTWGVRSAVTNPQSWALTKDFFPFPRKVYGIQGNGQRLAFVMEDKIGWVAGFGQSSFQREVDALPIGTKATHSIAGGVFSVKNGTSSTDVNGFYLLCPDSIYFITEDFQKIDVGSQLIEWWNDTNGVNKTYLHRSFGCYHKDLGWYVFAIPVGSSTEPDYLFVLDGKTGAIWPMPQPLGTKKIRGLTIIKDSLHIDRIVIQDDDGYAYKFDQDVLNYSGSAIESKWQSKIMDLGATYELREPQMEASASGNYDVDLYLKFDLESGDGAYDTFSLNDGTDVLGTTFMLGASVLGGKEFIFDDLDISGFGRFIQFMFKDYDVSSKFNIHELILNMKFIREGSLS